MNTAQFVRELEQIGVRLWEEGEHLHFRAPRGVMTEERKRGLAARKEAVLELLRGNATVRDVAEADPAGRNEPFPLTDVQAAYMLGRGTSFAYGGVACHAYVELRFASLDVPRLETAWRALISRHDMLRAVISSDGSQRVLRDVPTYRIEQEVAADDAAAETAASAVRAARSHEIRPADEWPLFDLRVTRGPGHAILHWSIDFLIADYVSIFILLGELRDLYEEPPRVLEPLEITFRDLMGSARRLASSGRHERDREYWWDRIDGLPPAPDLPQRRRTQPDVAVRFRRCAIELPPDAWSIIRGRASARSLTPSVAILAVYAGVVARWSRRPRFTLDLTLLHRPHLHPQAARVVGDFTSVDLLEIAHDASAPFFERAATIQAQLWSDLDHTACSGIEVLREIARRRGRDAALMPIVFTSALGLADAARDRAGLLGMGELVFGTSQTPQVWIDCQVMESSGALSLNWDIREGVFPDGLVDEMFAAFTDEVWALAAADDREWAQPASALPALQAERRRVVNDTARPLPDGRLHETVLAQAARTPDRPAVLGDTFWLTYGELARRAHATAVALRAQGCAPGEIVAVAMDKGWEQVVAVLGALLADAAYLPVDTTQPHLRRDALLADAGVRHVLTQSWLVDGGVWPSGLCTMAVDTLAAAPLPMAPAPHSGSPDELAYVIYTSGSTGAPKGVMISHRAALNTIEDVNRRFAVGPDDRVLGLANLGFDLSVYDLFGLLSVGGALVLPSHERRADPSHWAELIAKHSVTVWNSVPSQLQMLDDYLSVSGEALASLRLALLSGDWIPVGLPNRIRSKRRTVQVVSLGGATEAAIWSIAYPIGVVDDEWASIPYGRPLTNQRFLVLDEALRSRPEWVTGDLYISGVGLALGYWGDAAKTAERFVCDPETGERLYRTGDLGRYLPDGSIELLGREDSQVKIRGHRVELGEVEAALQSYPGVARAAVLVHGEGATDKRLVAFVEPARLDGGTGRVADPGRDRRVRAEAISAGTEVLLGVDRDAYLRYTRALDRVARVAMIRALRELGFFGTREDAHDQREILDAPGIVLGHHRLVRRWLRALESAGDIERDDVGRYRGAPPHDAATLEAAWRSFGENTRGFEREQVLVEYFRASSRQLPALLRGGDEARSLLFPQGRFDVTDALYRDALFNRWANGVAAGALRQLANESQGPLRILEVGAGSGGTSAIILEALGGVEIDYWLTDVSAFFVSEARRRFGERRGLRCSVYDLEQEPRGQGLLPNTFDVIVAGDVLHATRDVGRAIGQLAELLAPDGTMLVVEMTREHHQIMTSLELLVRVDPGTLDFADVRRGRDQTFLSRAQWSECLAEAGGKPVFSLPDDDDMLDELGICVLAVRFKEDRAAVATGALADHLAARLPEAMRPSSLQIVDSLPRSINGKIDRQVLQAWLPVTSAATAVARAEPTSDLERRIAEVWAEVLGTEPGRDDDFFALGGDSLLAARLAGQMTERLPEASSVFFDDLLRRILEGPTVAELACRLALLSDDAPFFGVARARSALVTLSSGGGGGPARVFVHGGSGLLAPYRDVIAALGERGGTQLGLEVVAHETYVAVAPASLFEVVASDYARLLRAAHPGPLEVVGWGDGALLAAEVARQLAESGTVVAGLTVITGFPRTEASGDEALSDALFLRELLGAPGQNPSVSTSRADGWATCSHALGLSPSEIEAVFRCYLHTTAACASASPSLYAGDIVVVCPDDDDPASTTPSADSVRYWTERCLGEVRVAHVSGDLFSCLRGEHAPRAIEAIATAWSNRRG